MQLLLLNVFLHCCECCHLLLGCCCGGTAGSGVLLQVVGGLHATGAVCEGYYTRYQWSVQLWAAAALPEAMLYSLDLPAPTAATAAAGVCCKQASALHPAAADRHHPRLHVLAWRPSSTCVSSSDQRGMLICELDQTIDVQRFLRVLSGVGQIAV